MAGHQELGLDLGIDVYLSDRRRAWQGGINENTNRLQGQYLAKSADLRSFSMRELDDFAEHINTRPGRVLDWAGAHDRLWPRLQTAWRH